jgi:hypothetical protein
MRTIFNGIAAVSAAWMLGTADCSAQTAATTVSFGSWDYARQTDEDGLANRVFARFNGEGGAALWLSCSRIDRDEGEPVTVLSAAITLKSYLGPSRGRGRSTITWLNDEPPEISYWVYRDRYGQMVGEDNIKSFVASLGKAEKLTVELTNYRLEARRVMFAFQQNKAQAVVERFTRDCGMLTNRES